MIKEVLLQHKKEKESLLSKVYVSREKLQMAKKFLSSELVKVVKGPRRSGKSVFSLLLLKETNFAYLNFDDENLLPYSTDEILTGIFEIYSKPRFLLFDEIQNLKGWELFINKLQRRGYNVLITGSNARLLSQELATALTGRHLPIDIFPLNLNEFLKAKNFLLPPEKEWSIPEVKWQILHYVEAYLKEGGFPEVAVKNLEVKTYLETLFDAILLKDIVRRYNVRFPQKLYELAQYLASNFSAQQTFTSIKNALNFSSVNTVEKYLSYLEEAYLVFFLKRFSYKVKEQYKAPRKVYIVDNGFIQATSFQFSPNIGRLMENLVFMELVKRGYQPNRQLFYYHTRNHKEVDLLLKEGTRVKGLLQVSYQRDDASQESEKREKKALLEASEELRCEDLMILTWDKEVIEKVGRKRLKWVPLWKWLLKPKFCNRL